MVTMSRLHRDFQWAIRDKQSLMLRARLWLTYVEVGSRLMQNRRWRCHKNKSVKQMIGMSGMGHSMSDQLMVCESPLRFR